MDNFNCIDELLKAVAMPALVLDEDFKVVLRNLPETQPNPWEGESPIGKTVFELFPAEQAKVLHEACLAATESKQPRTRRIGLVEAEQQRETTVKLIPFLNPASYSWGVILLLQYDSHTPGSAVKDAAPEEQPIGEGPPAQCTTPEVEDARAALRFFLQEGEKQLVKLKEETLSTMGKQFFPFIEGLKSTRLNKTQREYVDMIESCALKIAEPFARRISDPALRLSPTEIKIAGLIRAGKTNKDIAKIMELSKSTILTHRHHIRAKFGLLNKKQNLTMFLGALGTQLDAEAKAK
jgi:DNA-binding CsgD family transcriptional regulator